MPRWYCWGPCGPFSLRTAVLELFKVWREMLSAVTVKKMSPVVWFVSFDDRMNWIPPALSGSGKQVRVPLFSPRNKNVSDLQITLSLLMGILVCAYDNGLWLMTNSRHMRNIMIVFNSEWFRFWTCLYAWLAESRHGWWINSTAHANASQDIDSLFDLHDNRRR